MMIYVFDRVEKTLWEKEKMHFPFSHKVFYSSLSLSLWGSLAIESLTKNKVQSTEIIERKEENLGISLFEQT